MWYFKKVTILVGLISKLLTKLYIMYPHQVLMEEQKLQKENLTREAQNYLKDFNHFHRGVSLKQSRAEKKGKDFEVSESDTQKLIRLSTRVKDLV